MRRVLVVQPSIQPPGGGNGVAAWMLEALKLLHDVTLLTMEPPDLPAVNRYFGTALQKAQFRILVTSDVSRRLMRFTPLPMSMLKHNYLLVKCKRVQHDYEVVIGANNEADFGCRGIQYVHFPRFNPIRPKVDLRWYHGPLSLVKAYQLLCRLATGFSFARMRGNLTLVNSAWIGSMVRQVHGLEPVVLFPPSPGNFPKVPWAARENGFVCIGRLAAYKRFDTIIDILAKVRQRGFDDVHLHIIGAQDDLTHTRYLRQRAKENASWVFLEEDIPRERLVQIVARHRYGIHAMVGEHFGQAIAEMIKGGCIVFSHRSGGPVDIVAGDERLLFATPGEATEKIVQTLDDRQRQTSLRDHLADRKQLFTTARFVQRMQELVRDF